MHLTRLRTRSEDQAAQQTQQPQLSVRLGHAVRWWQSPHHRVYSAVHAVVRACGAFRVREMDEQEVLGCGRVGYAGQHCACLPPCRGGIGGCGLERGETLSAALQVEERRRGLLEGRRGDWSGHRVLEGTRGFPLRERRCVGWRVSPHAGYPTVGCHQLPLLHLLAGLHCFGVGKLHSRVNGGRQ